MVRRASIRLLPLLLLVLLAGCRADPEIEAWRIINSYAYPFPWEVSVTENQTGQEAQPGETLKIDYHADVDLSRYTERYGQFTEIIVAISGERRFDRNGYYRVGPNSYALSSNFTAAGLPIERLDGWRRYRLLQGDGGSPFEGVSSYPLTKGEAAKRHQFDGVLEIALPADIPEGYYEPNLSVLVRVAGVAEPVHLRSYGVNWNEAPKMVLPLVQVGKPATPQMPWSLFAQEYQMGRSGVLPEEMKGKVELVARSGFNSDFILRPGQYRLNPGFPSLFPHVHLAPVDGGLEVVPERIGHQLMLDHGQVACVVNGPDGKRDLGVKRFTGANEAGPELEGGGFAVDMRQTGRYEISLTGTVQDAFGRRFNGGGTYVVHIAMPITFSTSCKPGSGFIEGDKYPPKVNLIPSVPGEVEVVVEYYPNSDEARKQTWIGRGRANRFGHFTTHGQPALVFTEPGEYLSRVTAQFVDAEGRLWMGQQTSVGVIAPREPEMKLHGTRSFAYGNRVGKDYNGAMKQFRDRQDLTTSFLPYTPSMLPDPYAPYDPRDTLFIPSNGYNESLVEPHLSMSFDDPLLRRRFTQAYRLASHLVPPAHQSAQGAWEYLRDVVQISTDSFAWFPADEGVIDELPILPVADGPYHPFAFPENNRVDAYTYMGVVRPGFPVMTSIYQTDAIGLYWLASPNRYGGHFNTSLNGDLAGDVYRIQAGAVVLDHENGRNYYDAYGAAIVVIPSDGQATEILSPGEQPLITFNGREYDIFLAMDTHDAMEVGETIHVGGMVFPAIEADAVWHITKPSGEVVVSRAKANRLGIARGDTAVPIDEPGIYSIQANVFYEGLEGDIVGTTDGTFWHCAVPPGNVSFLQTDPQPVKKIDPAQGVRIPLRWPATLRNVKIHYGVMMPGQVLDQGVIEPDGQAWEYPFEPLQVATQYPNVDVRNYADGELELADTVVFQFFVEAEDGDGKVVDSLRLALRKSTLYNFPALMNGGRNTQPSHPH